MISRKALSAKVMAAMGQAIDNLIQDYKADNDSLVVMKGDEVIEISAEQLEKEVAEARAKDERENPTRS